MFGILVLFILMEKETQTFVFKTIAPVLSILISVLIIALLVLFFTDIVNLTALLIGLAALLICLFHELLYLKETIVVSPDALVLENVEYYNIDGGHSLVGKVSLKWHEIKEVELSFGYRFSYIIITPKNEGKVYYRKSLAEYVFGNRGKKIKEAIGHNWARARKKALNKSIPQPSAPVIRDWDCSW